MIISQHPAGRPVLSDTERLINQIVKKRIEKMTNETLDELIHVAECLSHIRRAYKPVLMDYPELDQALNRQVNELNRIANWIKREVA